VRDYRLGFGLDIRFIDHLHTQLGTTSNYNAFALKPSLHRLPYRTDLVAPIILLTTPRHSPRREHRSSISCVSVAVGICLPSSSLAAAVYSCLLRICCLAKDSFRCLFRGRCLETNIVSESFARNGCFSGSIVLALNKYSIIHTQSEI
jgi:hypothetical protein